jgi:AAA domain
MTHVGPEAAEPLTADERASLNGKGPHSDDKDYGECLMPHPRDAGKPPRSMWGHRGRDYDVGYTYRDAEGRILGYILRFEARDGKPKSFLPLTYWRDADGKGEWRRTPWPKGQRPLFGLDELAKKPDAIVLLPEGEKAKQAVKLGPLAEAFKWGEKNVVAVTWSGGGTAMKHSDFSPLRGRHVIVLPDDHQPGEETADEVIKILHDVGMRSVRRWKAPPEAKQVKAEGWDIADGIPPGWEPEAIVASILGAPEVVADQPASLNERDAGDDPGKIPPRGWLLGNQFCRRFVSSLVAAGGVGKTSLRMLQYLSLASGRPLTGQHVFRRSRVLLLSFEDDNQELDRRIAAALKHHNVDRSEIKGRLYIAAPKGVKLAEMKGGTRHIGELEKLLREAIQRRKPDIIGLDPFIKVHALEENDNGAMDFVCDLLTKLAIEFDIAIDVPHHTKKGQLTPGDADNGRGGGSIRDAARLVYTLAAMAEEEAKTFGIPEGERRSYVRLDSAKVNIARHAGKATWFRLVNVRLENGTEMYPNGDEVQTIEPWTPPDTWAGTSSADLNAALTDIEAGLLNGQRYSHANAARERAAWTVVQRHLPSKTEGQCREMVRTWIKNGVLYLEDYPDPITRNARKGLRLDTSKRPS